MAETTNKEASRPRKPRRKAPPRKPLSVVTGACGFIGSHVVEQAVKAGHDVVAADHPGAWQGGDSLANGRYPDLVRSLAYKCVEIDLAQPGSFSGLPRNVDYVFHVAAVFNYTAPYELLHQINVLGGKALLEYFGGSPRLKRFVQWGAGGVYGAPSARGNVPFTEDMAPMPANNYLKSKWEQEHMVMSTAPGLGVDYTIIRPTTVYGPRGAYGSIEMFTSMVEGPVIAIPANMTGHIPFIHVVDVACAAIYLATRKDAVNQVFNFNDDTDITTVEFMQAMARLTGKPFIKLPPVPLGHLLKALAPALQFQFWLARDVLKVKPPVEPDLLAMATEDFQYDNSKLKATEYEFAYPDARMAFADTLQWYRDNK